MDNLNNPPLSNEFLWLLTELTSELSLVTDLEELHQLLNRRLRWLFDFNCCSLALRLEPTADRMQLLEIGNADAPTAQTLPLADNWPSRVIMEGKPYFIENIANLTGLHPSIKLPADPISGVSPEARSLMLLPLQFGGQLIGSLNFSLNQPNGYPVAWRNVAVMLAAHLSGKLGSILAYRSTSTSLADLLTYQTQHNNVIGLPDRKLFETRLQQILNQAQPLKQGIAVLALNFNRLKLINDTLGHEVGDIALQQVMQCLQGVVYQSDIVTRIGDEFMLVLTKSKHSQGAIQVAEKLLEIFQKPLLVQDHELFMTPNIGISFCSPNGETARELMRQANIALHSIKTREQRQYQLFNPAIDVAPDRLLIEAELRKAIERGEMRLHYQPQIELAGSRLISMEALIRWHHPELGMVSPARFIPLAEETGMIIPLGTWVLKEACRQNRAWQQSGHPPLVISINVSALQIQQPDFVELVFQTLEETGLEPCYIELELTESIFVHNYQKTALKLDRLRAAGIKIALDDFGTGYSSFSYLQSLPLDTLKIDQSFIRTMAAGLYSGSQPNEGAIIQAIITMAHSLGLEVIAEGVEIEQQREFLKNSGCDKMQGYLFSAPLDPTEFEALLHRQDLQPFYSPAKRLDPVLLEA